MRLFSKLVGKIATMSFDWRWIAAFFLFTFARRNNEISLQDPFYNCSITNHGMCQWWQLLQATNTLNTIMIVVKVMTILSCFNQWEFSVSGETGNSLFSKGVHCPSIFLSPNLVPSQVFRFALVSSPLIILSKHSMIKRKYEKIEGCQQSIIIAQWATKTVSNCPGNWF